MLVRIRDEAQTKPGKTMMVNTDHVVSVEMFDFVGQDCIFPAVRVNMVDGVSHLSTHRTYRERDEFVSLLSHQRTLI